MILAAAACAAAGISYIFADDEPSVETKYEAVTVSSTTVDKQGIVQYVSYPQWRRPYSLLHQPYKGISSLIYECRLNRYQTPLVRPRQIQQAAFTSELSVVFFWSMPLKARLLEICTKQCATVQNLNSFKRNLMTISVGTQNEVSEIVSCNPDEHSYRRESASESNNGEEMLDVLAYPPVVNDEVVPIGILKKNKFSLNERNTNRKRFCGERNLNVDENDSMRNMIVKNVNLCVENLSKILSVSCSNDEEQSATLEVASSVGSIVGKNNNKHKTSSVDDVHSQSSKQQEDLGSEHSDLHCLEQPSDGIILHRGQRFGTSLGEPMIRKYHSIQELHRLLSKTSCVLMQQHQIASIEDLIRLFLAQGQHHFTELLITLFKVDPLVVEQLNRILVLWAERMT